MTKRVSLKTQMLHGSIAVFLICLALYFMLNAAGTVFLERVYTGEEAAAERRAAIYSDFAEYVKINALDSSDDEAILSWTAKHQNYRITVYTAGQRFSAYLNDVIETGISISPPDAESMLPVDFSDAQLKIEIEDLTAQRMHLTLKLSAIAISGIVFVLLGFIYTRTLTRRIIALSTEATKVSEGDIHHSIRVDGNDELTELALLMDKMRQSVIERMGSEGRAWESNAELITAISHDIRTPMTSMLGYLGLLKDNSFEDMESCRQFINHAYGKAIELKDLTDELFRYFLLFGKSELDLQLDSFDGRLLLEQLMAETEFELRDAGFKVQRAEAEIDCTLMLDPLYLKRVVDNMVSNIKKYADSSRPVMFVTEQCDGQVSLCISNYISRSMDRVESTKIGLKSCTKIMQAMSGDFIINTDSEHFAAEIIIPRK